MLTKHQEKLAKEEVFRVTGIKNFKKITSNILLDESTNTLVCFNYTASLNQLRNGNFTELATSNTGGFENAKKMNRLLNHKGNGIYVLVVHTPQGVLSYATNLEDMLNFYLDGAISKNNRFIFRANIEDAINKKETLSLHATSDKNKKIYINLYKKHSTMSQDLNPNTPTVFDKIKENREKKDVFELSLDELNMLQHSPGQRCGITREKDTANVYHPLEHQEFDERVKQTEKSILENGWNDNLVPFRFALCKEDNKFYVTDGQATTAACNHIKESASKSYLLPEKYSCMYDGYLTLEEIDSLTYDMNGGTHKKKWKASDNVAAELRKHGGKPLEEFLKMKDFQQETDTGETAISYMLIGDFIKRKMKAEDFKLRDYYELYADFYRDFVNNSGKVYVDDALISEDKKVAPYRSRHKATRAEGLAKHLMQTLDMCVYVCKTHNLNPYTYVPSYGKKLMKDVFNSKDVRLKKWDDIVLTPKTRFMDFAKKINLYSTVAYTFKDKLPADVLKKDYKDFLAKKIVESEIKI